MLVSANAEKLLHRHPGQRLSQDQVCRALQIDVTTADQRRLVVRTVGALAAVFADPPQWLLETHGHLAERRAETAASRSASRAPIFVPHPDILFSTKALRTCERPPQTVLSVVQVSKVLQYPQLTDELVRRLANVNTVHDLRKLLSDPPPWLLEYHALIATTTIQKRAGDLVGQEA